MSLNLALSEYESSRGWREAAKWAFAIGTLGLGALYLWSTTTIIRTGEIGLRRNYQGKMILLPPGRHSNFPWETYPCKPKSLSETVINLEPYKIINVETGYVAKTLNKGVLEILSEGQHLLEHAAHVFAGFISVKQETKKLHAVTGFTNDSVGLTLQADVRYQIEDPKTAIKEIDNIDHSITQIAEISISQIASHHKLTDIAPLTNIGQNQNHGMSKLIQEFTDSITKQLKELGIKLVNIGITSWSINDQQLAHELGQGAVIQSQARSKMISAEQEANVKRVLAEADAKARVTAAAAEAEAIELKGAAIKKLTEQFKDNPAAQEIYRQSLQVELVKGAVNPYLFFSSQPANSSTSQLPQLTIPLTPSTPVPPPPPGFGS